MASMKKIELLMKSILIGLSVFYLVAGIYFVLNAKTDFKVRLVVMLLLILDAVLYQMLNVWKNSHKLFIRIMWISIVIGNIILTVTDQVGFADWVLIVLNCTVLILYLIKQRKQISG